MKSNLLLLSFISGFMYSCEQRATVVVEKDCKTYIGGMKSYCECGKDPVLVMFLYGNLKMYCAQHMPEMERVRKITPENLADILRKES